MGNPNASSPSFVSEDELISWLRQHTADRGGRRIGDDAAVLPASDSWAVTMDSQIEGVHFQPGLDPKTIARRLLAVNLSDLAAMGAVPRFAFLALSAPRDFDQRRFFTAFVGACEEHALDLAGGDLAKSSRVVAVLTLLGSKPIDSRWLLRSNARIGESLWIGGTLGEAAAGLVLLERGAVLEKSSLSIPAELDLPDHLEEPALRAVQRQLLPSAQLELGAWLGKRTAVAAIDVSDGLAKDLSRLCKESGVGAEVEIELLPLSEDLEKLSRAFDRDWRQLALFGGEDYVLLFTLPVGTEPPKRFGSARIGTMVDGPIVLLEKGERSPLPPLGWDHFQNG